MSKELISQAMRNNNARHGYTIVGHGYLTRGDGTGTFIADQNNRIGFYWQQSDDDNQRVVGVGTVDDSIVFENNRDYEKFAVDLGYKPNDSKLYILGQNSYGMNTGGGSTINERKIAELAQGIKLPLAVTADKTQPSLKVFINSWTPAIAGTGASLFPISEVNLTDYIPSSSNQMCYVAIFIQSDYATIEITTSTPRSTSGLPLSRNDLNEAVAAATAGDTAVYAVKLVNGQTTITQSDLNNNGWPLQPYVSLATSSGGGSGTVTSVALTVPARQTVAGSPITTSGTLAITDNNQSANKFLGGPTTGSPAAPDYRALVTADLPSGVGDVVGPSSAVNNDLAAFDTTTGKLIKDSGLTTANAGKAIAALADKFLLQTPDTTNLPNAQAMSALATGLVKNTTGTGVQSIAAAGTDYLAPAAIGVTVAAHSTELDTIAGLSPTNGNFLKRVTGAWAAVNIAASDILSGLLALGRGGTHADLSATGPGFLKQATNGADVTVAAVDLSTSDATGTLAASRFPALTGDVTTSAGALATTLATVNGNVGTFSRVKSVTANAKGLITAITQGLVDLASEITGTLAIGNGGTGQTTQTLAFNALDPLTTKGDIITNDGTNSVRQAAGSDGQGIIYQAAQTNGLYTRNILYPPNLLVNSGFDLWSRQAIAPGTAAVYTNDNYTADDWYVLCTNGNPINAFRGSGIGLQGSTHALQLETTSSMQCGNAQIAENAISKQMRGRTIRFQADFEITGGASNVHVAILEWTGTADAVTSDVVNNWASTNYTTGNFFKATSFTLVGHAVASLSNSTITAISVSGSVSASCNNLIVFAWVETSVSGREFLIAEAGLYEGADPIIWIAPDPAVESIRAQRFLKVFYSANGKTTFLFHGQATATNTESFTYLPPVSFRITPALTATAADWQVQNGTGVSAVTAISLNADSTPDAVTITTTAASTVALVRLFSGDSSGDRYLILSAEL